MICPNCGVDKESTLVSAKALLKERDELRKQVEQLEAELETERMRLAACGVVALANTPESAAKARDMLPEYYSGSCEGVEPKIDVEPDAWATKDMCVGPNLGRVRYDKLPIQSMNPLQYTHEKLYSEETVIGLLKATYEAGKVDGWDACETCHGINERAACP